MIRRFLPLVLALLVAGAPLAAEICHVTCVGTQAGRGIHRTAHDQSCHHAKAGSPGPAIASVPHACGDSDGIPAISNAATRTANAVAFVFDTGASALPLDTASSPFRAPPNPRESILPPSTTPLRL